jgi:hypothetical protein
MADSGKMMPMFPNFAGMRSWICLTLVILMLTSCEPEEPLYPAPKQIQGLQTLMLDLGEDRNRDIWVNLGELRQKLPMVLSGIWGFPVFPAVGI